MKKFLTNIAHEAKDIRMTKAEKSAMLARILGAPAPEAPQQSPYVFLSYFSHNVRMVMAGFTLFIFAGFSTVSAAQGALPGDLLYPVKLSINEKVEMAFTADGASRAVLEVSLAERRVEEAQSLAAQGRLDVQAADALAARFDFHAQNAQTLADATEAIEPGIAEQVKAKLSASIATNAAVLRKLGSNNATKEQSDALSSRVLARAESPVIAMEARSFAATVAPVPAQMKAAGGAGGGVSVDAVSLSVANDATLAADDASAQKRAAYFQKNAAAALAAARKEFKDAAFRVDATTTAQIEERFTRIDLEMSAGADALGQNAYALAQEHFAAALQQSEKLGALLKAEKKFDNGILKSLIQFEIPVDASSPTTLEVNIIPVQTNTPASGSGVQVNAPAVEVTAPAPAAVPSVSLPSIRLGL